MFTTAGSDDKTAFCRSLGADHAINYRTQDFVAEVARITGKSGVDVILDMVGGDYIEKNLKCLALEGRLVHDRLPARRPRRGRLAAHHDEAPDRHRLDASREPARAQGRAGEARCARTCGRCSSAARLKTVVHRVFPLAEAAAAHALMESSQHIGKIMLAVR